MKNILLAAAICLSAAAVAHAQKRKDKPGPLPGDGIDWKGDWNEATKEATARNVPVLFVIHNDSAQDSVDMAETVYTDAKVIDASRAFVCIVAHQETGHGDHQVQIGKQTLDLCKRYYTVPCSVHTEGWKNVGKYNQGGGNFPVPLHIFCDQGGKELFRKDGKLSSGDLLKEMDKASKRISGEKVRLEQWNYAKKMIADADKHLEKKEYKKAVELYLKVNKMKPGFGFKDMAAPGLDKVDKVGQDLIKEALDLPDVDGKKKALKKIVDDFKGASTSTAAEKELDKLK